MKRILRLFSISAICLLLVIACHDKEDFLSSEITNDAIVQRSLPQTWEATAPMAIARSRHTSTLLPSGDVVVTGGITGLLFNPQPTSSVELFSPESASWSFAKAMHVGRSRHTATLLPDGRLLVIGGRAQGFTTSSAETYDPDADQWTLVASMHIAREYHTATLLANGQVLVTGGLSFAEGLDNPAEKSAEIYDPVIDQWTIVDHMHNSRWGHSATMRNDGTVLVAGGSGPAGDGVYTVRAEIYDPLQDVWYQADGMTSPRGFHAATLLADGSVLVAGGLTLPANQPNRNTSTELFINDEWILTGTMNFPRGNIRSSCTLLDDGRFLVAGGPGITAEVYNPFTGAWTPTGSMTMARSNHTLTFLQDGSVLATGGENREGFIASAEIYQPD